MSKRRHLFAGAQRFSWFVHLHQGASAIAADHLPAQIHIAYVDLLAGAHIRELDGDQRPIDFDNLTHLRPRRVEASAVRRWSLAMTQPIFPCVLRKNYQNEYSRRR